MAGVDLKHTCSPSLSKYSCTWYDTKLNATPYTTSFKSYSL